MKKIKHSKYKNTRILFELLTRQITVDILNEKDSSEAIDILKEYFGGQTELSKEHSLYKTLLSENFNSRDRAEELLDEVIDRRKKLNDKKISDQKYNLVGDIKENYPLDDFFQSRIENYREYASIYKVFSYFNDDKDYDPADAVRSKETIVEHITSEPSDSPDKKNEGELSKVLENYRDQSKDLRLLTQKLLIEKFNERYDSLLDEQKKLLKKYINNVSNTNNLREYVNKEVDRVRNELKELVDDIDIESTRIKVKETINLSEDLKKGNYVRDDQVSTLMMYYQLLDEVKSNVK